MSHPFWGGFLRFWSHMAIPHAKKLIDRARLGERLNTKERRHALAFILATEPHYTNAEMGELFQVSERQIRLDKKKLREDKARIIKEDDVGLIVADIALAFDAQVRDMEKSKTKAAVGTRVYLDHCIKIFELNAKKVAIFQELGYLPKNLGQMQVQRFDFKAVVTSDGSVNTRPVDLVIDAEEPQQIEAEPIRLALPAPLPETEEQT